MTALIIVDLQNDFLPKGSLAVADGDQIIPLINKLLAHPFFNICVATQDWHPANHVSFASNHPNQSVGDVITWHNSQQILWPDHCLQNSTGAQLSSVLAITSLDHRIHKGCDPDIDSYSAFFDNDHSHNTGLAQYLHEKNITDIYIAGLTTDYCVKFTALDALKLNFNTFVIADACKGVNIHEGDANAALKCMQQAGVHVIHSDDILNNTFCGS